MKNAKPSTDSESKTLQIRIIDDKVRDIHPDGTRLLKFGDVVEVPRERGIDLVNRGIASAFSRVRSKENHVSIGNRVAMRGEEAWCFPDVAERWEKEGRLEVLETAPGYRKASSSFHYPALG